MINLEDYYSGGYYITHYIEHPAFIPEAMRPVRTVTLTPCLNQFYPDHWSIEWCTLSDWQRLRSSSMFGTTPENISSFIRRVTDLVGIDFDLPNTCRSLDIARQYVGELAHKPDSLVIIGLGLHHSLVNDFLAETKPPVSEPGYAPIGECGSHLAISRKERLEPKGRKLGFEPLCFDDFGGRTCSWFCNGLEVPCQDQLGIGMNSLCLIDDFTDAMRCMEYISRDETGAEPGYWVPWLLVSYPFT